MIVAHRRRRGDGALEFWTTVRSKRGSDAVSPDRSPAEEVEKNEAACSAVSALAVLARARHTATKHSMAV